MPVFQYGDHAEQHNLPTIADCYAMNVDQTGSVWINCYMDFLLVQVRNFKAERVWKEVGSFGSVFAVRGEEVIHTHGKQLAVSQLEHLQDEPGPAYAEDETLLGVAQRTTVTSVFTEVIAIRQLLNYALEGIACGEAVTREAFQAEVQTIRRTKHKAAEQLMQQYAATEKRS